MEFVRHALFAVVGSVAQFADARRSGAFETFERVLIQDSTTLQLHPRLAAAFPGSRNQLGKTHALAKIQATYDLLAEQFVCFDLTAFTRNDQAASQDILNLARPGDLVLRDLGYFVLSVFAKLHKGGVFFLSRLRWRIEIIFKAWKSHFRIAELPNGSAAQIQTMIYARLLFLCLFQTLFDPLAIYFQHVYGRSLSLLRFAQFLALHHWIIISLVHTPKGKPLLENLLLRHCCYEKRPDRHNHIQEILCLG